MANAVTFWKGSATNFASKTYVDGRIYFVTDNDNLGSLYLGVAGKEGEAVTAVMISPKRLTALALDTSDDKSSVTAKAVVDFVKENFDAKGAYDEAIEGIEGRLSALEGTLDGYGANGDAYATVKAHFDAVEGRLTTTEGVATGAAAAVATKVEQSEYEAKVKELDDAIKAITGEGEGGDATTIAGLAAKVSTLEGEMDSAEGRLDAIEGQLDGIEGTVKDALDLKANAADVYTKGEADDLLSGKVDKTTKVNGHALSSDVTLVAADIADVYSTTETDNAISAAVSASEATIQGKLDLKANAADVYTKEEVGNMLSAALEFKGTKATAEELPTDAETGDVYFVTADQSEYVFVKGTGEVVDKWEKLGPVVDYSQFAQASNVYTKKEADDLLATKMDKVAEGKKGEVLTATADGHSEVSGYTLGGATLGTTTGEGEDAVTTYSATKLATEAAVIAALTWLED